MTIVYRKAFEKYEKTKKYLGKFKKNIRNDQDLGGYKKKIMLRPAVLLLRPISWIGYCVSTLNAYTSVSQTWQPIRRISDRRKDKVETDEPSLQTRLILTTQHTPVL